MRLWVPAVARPAVEGVLTGRLERSVSSAGGGGVQVARWRGVRSARTSWMSSASICAVA